MGLPWKSRVPFLISKFERLERREEADRLKPLCRVCSNSQQCVVGCCREKPSQMKALRKGRSALPSQLLKTSMKLHVVWDGNCPSHSSRYAGGVSQNSGIYQGFAVSMWLLWLGLVCKTNKGSTIHRQLIVSLNSFTLIRSWNQSCPDISFWPAVAFSESLWSSQSLWVPPPPLPPVLHNPFQFSTPVFCILGK